MLVIKILIITFFVLLAILIVFGIHTLIETKKDNEVIYKYNSKMNEVRKERAWQEKEKQRKIRGEAEDAPKYAAGGDMDRITRRRY